jgi:hypothetical protein
MLVPILIFFACFGIGVTASARWLPELGQGSVGGLAFLVVCGLLTGALILAGLDVYTIVKEIHEFGGLKSPVNTDSPQILATGIRNIVLESGTLIGLAGIVYLLAPPGSDQSTTQELQPTVSLAEADG